MSDFPEANYAPIESLDIDPKRRPKKSKNALCCSLFTLVISIPALIGN